MRKELKYIQIVALVIMTIAYFGMRSIPRSNPAAIPSNGELIYVERAVDGDTLKLVNGQRVRLIGVDTPEAHYSNKLLRDSKRTHQGIETTQAMGKRASDFTKSLVAGKRVRLEFDVEKRDRHRRLLAYVYLEDGTFVNAKILEEGYAQVMTIPPNVKHADYFLRLEQEAREKNRGLWKDDVEVP